MTNPKVQEKKGLRGFQRGSFFFEREISTISSREELIWLAHLFLLPYYKYLCKQPGLFYESEDTDTLRLLSAYRHEDNERNCTSEKKTGKGGD